MVFDGEKITDTSNRTLIGMLKNLPPQRPITLSIDPLCPFCFAEERDLVAMKDHILHYCDVFEETEIEG